MILSDLPVRDHGRGPCSDGRADRAAPVAQKYSRTREWLGGRPLHLASCYGVRSSGLAFTIIEVGFSVCSLKNRPNFPQLANFRVCSITALRILQTSITSLGLVCGLSSQEHDKACEANSRGPCAVKLRPILDVQQHRVSHLDKCSLETCPSARPKMETNKIPIAPR